ncbi:DUF202 domain-containing protein [Kineococcus sp. LSe6-4]|uniref:DUF202 domain-containing protein n=1 Tax=Kineococcus halophytocola TaxID=3234027 RepID=A0ABV4GYK7_9ACTN
MSTDRTEPAPRRIYDVGLQPERTALAWRRTALSMMVASLGAARVLPSQLGGGAVVLGLIGIVWAVLVHHLAGRRARRSTARLLTAGDLAHPHSAGVLLAGTAAATALLGLGGLALVLHRILE